MGNDIWEEFAKENPEDYILTGDISYLTTKGEKHFFESGKKLTQQTIEEVGELFPGKERALEIGCGTGRLTLPHARIFNEIIAVDISPTMLAKLNENAKQLDQDNIKTFLPSQNWMDSPVDYAYSYLVFQHIEKLEIIMGYVENISRSLKPEGIAHLQFDTRPKSISYKIRNQLPDFLLPKSQRKGIRRIRRTAGVLKSIFKENGLRVLRERNPNTANHFFLLEKDVE